MILSIFLFLQAYFVFGAILFTIINRNKTKEIRKYNWIKYFTYLIIVDSLFATIILNNTIFNYICILISVLGFLEILHLLLKSKNYYIGILSILIYLGIVILFYLFSQMEKNNILFTFYLVIIFDAMSQLSGQLLGKRKLIPAISPNKTTEGLLGGLIFTVFTGILIKDLIHENLIYSITLSIAISAFAFIGDILASFLKRKLNVKDFSNVIPGHGGVLDRFDSLIFAGAFIYLISKF